MLFKEKTKEHCEYLDTIYEWVYRYVHRYCDRYINTDQAPEELETLIAQITALYKKLDFEVIKVVKLVNVNGVYAIKVFVIDHYVGFAQKDIHWYALI